MRIKSVALLIVLFFSLTASSQSPRELLKTLKLELRSAERLSRLRKNKDPNLLFRVISIRSEILSIKWKKDNERYLGLSPAKRRNLPLKNYLKSSYSEYRKIQALGRKTLSRFKKFRTKPDLYLALALLAADFKRTDILEPYLVNASKLSSKKSSIYLASKQALGDFYFANKKYKGAIKVYSIVVKDKRQKHYSRYLYNLAWSYFSTTNYSKALRAIKEVVGRKRNEFDKNVRKEAMKNIHAFFVRSGRISEAIKFYKGKSKNSREYIDSLLLLGGYAVYNGRKRDGLKILQLAERVAEKSNGFNSHTVLKLADIYSENGLYSKFIRLINKLGKQKIVGEEKKQLVDLIKKYVNTQTKVIDKKIQNKQKITKSRYIGTLVALEKLTVLEPKNASRYRYGMGSIYQTNFEFKKSMSSFERALDLKIKERKGKPLDKQGQKILRSTLETLSLSENSKQKFSTEKYREVYERYLKFYSKDSTAQKIYPDLFKIYMKKKMTGKAYNILVRYGKNFPRDVKNQSAMMSQILEEARNKNDIKSFSNYLAKIEKGEFRVDRDLLKKSYSVLENMQFEKVSKLVKSKNIPAALEEYKVLYTNPKFSSDTKKKIAFNSMLLAQKVYDIEKMNYWVSRWTTRLSKSNLTPNENSALRSIIDTYYKNDLYKSALGYSFWALKKTCRKDTKTSRFYLRNVINFSYISNDFQKFKYASSNHRNCGMNDSEFDEMSVGIYEDSSSSASRGKKKLFANYLSGRKVIKNGRAKKKFTDIQVSAIKAAMPIKSPLISGRNRAYFSGTPHLAVENLRSYINQNPLRKPTFPESKLQGDIQFNLGVVGNAKVKADSIMNSRDPYAVAHSYVLLLYLYSTFIKYNEAIAIPKDKPPEYVKTFKQSVAGLQAPVAKAIKEFDSSYRTILRKAPLFTVFNFYYWGSKNKYSEIFYYDSDRPLINNKRSL